MRISLMFLTAVVVASGCVHTAGEDTSNPADETSELTDRTADNNTIFFTDSGFQPESLTVEQGETVTWLDRSSSTMWIASDRHPTHMEYAGSSLSEHCSGGDQTSRAFDQCSNGERFSFTFEKTGSWGYHNHKPFVQGGTITVR